MTDFPELADRIALAIGDPGFFVGRDRLEGESVTRWSTRAVLHVLTEEGLIQDGAR